MAFNIFERYKQQPSAPQEEAKGVSNDNPTPLEQLQAERARLEQQIEIGGQSTPEDRDMLTDLDRRIALLKEAA
jgi:hypothetical protein